MKRSKRQLLTIRRKDDNQGSMPVPTNKPTNRECNANVNRNTSSALNMKELLVMGGESEVNTKKEKDVSNKSIHIDIDVNSILERKSDIPVDNSKPLHISSIPTEELYRISNCFAPTVQSNVLQRTQLRCCFINQLKT